MSNEAWALVFMLLVLKIPVVYICSVIWYAIKAEPEPGVDPHQDSSPWKPWGKPTRPRHGRGGPHGRRGASRKARAVRRGRVGA